MSTNDDPYNYDYDSYRPPTLTGAGEVHAPSASPYFTSFDYHSNNLTHNDLEQREYMIQEREREIEVMEKDVKTDQKSWPICYPIIRHSIRADVPAGPRRAAVVMSYLGWFLFSLIVVLNLGSAIATVVVDTKVASLSTKKKIQMLFMASAYLLSIPAFFIFAHFPIYHAMRTVNMSRFFIFFLGYSTVLIFSGFSVAGWVEYGACGIVGAVQFLQKGLKNKYSLAGFIINFSMSGLWLFITVYSFVVFAIALFVYWRQNSTFAKAKVFAKKHLEKKGTVVEQQQQSDTMTATDVQTV